MIPRSLWMVCIDLLLTNTVCGHHTASANKGVKCWLTFFQTFFTASLLCIIFTDPHTNFILEFAWRESLEVWNSCRRLIWHFIMKKQFGSCQLGPWFKKYSTIQYLYFEQMDLVTAWNREATPHRFNTYGSFPDLCILLLLPLPFSFYYCGR